MSSIQERLQLKRVPLDTWNIREQLCLASAVVRSGDQNWMSVSRAIKTIGEATRPPDWYSQKSCAAQYGVLLENVETPKRKKRNSEGAVETPQESIYKMLTQQRIAEIQNTLTEMNNQYEQLKNEVAEVSNPSTSEERLQELWAGVEAAKRARERENARRTAWLKEREERRTRVERTWRPTTTPPSTPSPAPPSSPLLTSLLKSSPVVTTPQHIPHPATIVDAVSPSAGAPTLSLLLEQGQRESKHAAIEHIKSQLVQIEHQLKASSSSPVVPAVPVPAVVPGAAPAVDIDDIEIKAEDVYAFRDVDIHLPPVTAIHKPVRTPEKATLKRDEEAPAPPPVEEEVLLKEEPAQAEVVVADVTTDVEMSEEPQPTPKQEPEAPEPEIKVTEVEVAPEVALEVTEVEVKFPAAEVKFPAPEVKFPTPEIKVIAPDDDQVKEEMKGEAESGAVEDAPPDPPPADDTTERSDTVEEIPVPAEAAPPTPPMLAAEPSAVDPGDIPLPPGDPAPPPTDIASIPSPDGPAPADSPSELEMIQREMEGPAGRTDADDGRTDADDGRTDADDGRTDVQDGQTDADADRTDEQDVKKEDDAEDSIPLKEMMECVVGGGAEGAAAGEAREDDNTETDDDTPMEVRMLSREEEKDGKKKRDYSRKKKSDSRTCSGSESAAEASAPESPSAADERQHRLWRKSVMLVYSRLCAHKYASLFLRPISDEEAPGYSTVVKRPMDLTTIRRHIDAGRIRSTAELQRDVLLMLANALMYNSSRHSVYAMAKEMHEEAQNQLGMLLAAQAHAGLVAEPPRRKRRPAAHATPTKRRHT